MGSRAQIDSHPAWVSELLKPDAYPHAVGRVQLIETHISWVFLTGQYAYKIKKPVDLGFVDFSSLDRRKYFCEEELRLNRRNSDDIYLDVVPIGLRDGHARIGIEPAMEYAVRMRQFPAEARLDRRLEAGKVKAEDLRAAAVGLAAFYSHLPAREGVGPEQSAENACRSALNNFTHLKGSHISAASRRQIKTIQSWTREQAESLKPIFSKRAAAGFVRECHGDLHLANLFERNGRICPFDSLEFDPGLRWIDMVSDIAFLVMDLMARERPDLAYVFLNTWLEETGDYEGLAVLRFYLVYRCMVRLKVAAIQTEQLREDARGEHAIRARLYLSLASELMHALPHPWLVLMHGFSGSGKTHSSDTLITTLPAVRVRSDLERKRLHGPGRLQRSASGIEVGLYSASASLKTYTKLARHCETGLRSGFNMIADAAFLKRAWRGRFIELARTLGARPVIVDCSASPEVLRQRIHKRMAQGTDASDADLAVLEHQMAHHDPLNDKERLLRVEDPGDLTHWG